MLSFLFFILGGKSPMKMSSLILVYIYVAEKEGCLFESETRSLGFLQNPEKGNTRHEYGQDKPTGEFPPPKSIYSTDAIA